MSPCIVAPACMSSAWLHRRPVCAHLCLCGWWSGAAEWRGVARRVYVCRDPALGVHTCGDARVRRFRGRPARYIVGRGWRMSASRGFVVRVWSSGGAVLLSLRSSPSPPPHCVCGLALEAALSLLLTHVPYAAPAAVLASVSLYFFTLYRPFDCRTAC